MQQTILWLNDGSGRFAPAPRSLFNGFEGGIVPVDLNGDGKLDYLSFKPDGFWQNSLSTWTFKTHLNYDAPPPPSPPPLTEEEVYAGNNFLKGTSSNNVLKGYGGKDVLKASSGNDCLYGGTGNDTLYGEKGKDSFVFDTAPHKSSNKDAIMDFKVVDDTIRLDNAVFTKLGGNGSLKSSAFWAKHHGQST